MKQGWLASETTDAPELSRSVKCCLLFLCSMLRLCLSDELDEMA